MPTAKKSKRRVVRFKPGKALLRRRRQKAGRKGGKSRRRVVKFKPGKELRARRRRTYGKVAKFKAGTDLASKLNK